MRTNHRLASSIVRFVDRFLAGRLRGLLPEEKRYWILVPVTGVVSGLLAVLLVTLLRIIQEQCWGSSEDVGLGIRDTYELKRVLITTGGGLLVTFYVYCQRRSSDLVGTAGLIEALCVGQGRVPALRTFITSLVSIVAVGTGASVGREGALINSGAASGSWLGTTFRLREHHVKVLLACGAAGGMAASYNVPIGATVFAMEVLLGSLALDLFGPIIVCSVIATAISRALLNTTLLYQMPVSESLQLVNEGVGGTGGTFPNMLVYNVQFVLVEYQDEAVSQDRLQYVFGIHVCSPHSLFK